MPIPTKFRMNRDINGYNGFGLSFPEAAAQGKLTASTEQTITVPNTDTGKRILAVFSFESGDPVWIAKNTTATIPTGTPVATRSIKGPVAREVFSGDVLHIISSASDVEYGVEFYALD